MIGVHSASVLLVEDNPGYADLIREAAGEPAFGVLTIQSVDRLSLALERCRGETFDAVLLDLGLADSQGIETLVTMRDAFPLTPLVILTGNDQQALAMEALKLGAQDYLVKGEADFKTIARSVFYAIERARRKRLDAEVNELREAMEHAVQAFARFDAAGRYVSVNQAYAHMFARTQEELVGQPAAQVFPGDHAVLRDALQRMRTDGRAVAEVRSYAADGSLRVQNQTFVAARDELGGFKGHFLFVEDITEKKNLEQQLILADRLASVGTLAAGVAHEINNPLTYIIVNLEFVSKGLLEWGRKLGGDGADTPDLAHCRFLVDDFQTAIQDAANGADRVRSIVKDLRVFARAPDNAMEVVSVRSILESALNVTRSEILHRSRLINKCIGSPSVFVNESRLGQVFLNILLNAVQALPEEQTGRNVITVDCRTQGNEVLVEFADTGAGISPAHLERIFDPFFTTKPVGLGTGLGLSICYGIVKSFGGRMEVTSVLGQGSTFRVFLPSLPETESATARISLQPDKTRKRILVIDDEPLIGITIRRALSKEHDVTTVLGAAEALALLDENPDYHLIFCDLIMPGKSGMEFYTQLGTALRHLQERIVFMSGGPPPPEATRVLDHIPNVLIEKPFGALEINAVIQKVLGKTHRSS